MTANAIPTPTAWPIQFGQRDAKVIETATTAAGTISNKTIDSTNSVDIAALPSITNAKLAGSIAAAKMLTVPGFVVKFCQVGTSITGTTLTGVAVGDIIFTLTPGAGGVAAIAVDTAVAINTLVTDPADTDWVLVLRAAA